MRAPIWHPYVQRIAPRTGVRSCRHIAELQQALGDAAQDSDDIENAPERGYRLSLLTGDVESEAASGATGPGDPVCSAGISRYAWCDAPVAQWIEHRTSDPTVGGSNPSRRASFGPR